MSSSEFRPEDAIPNRVPEEWVASLDHALNIGAPTEDHLDALYALLAWLKERAT